MGTGGEGGKGTGTGRERERKKAREGGREVESETYKRHINQLIPLHLMLVPARIRP